INRFMNPPPATGHVCAVRHISMSCSAVLRFASRILANGLNRGTEGDAVGLRPEPDDGPHVLPPGSAQALGPVVPVLEHELPVATRDDHRRRLPAVLLDAPHHVVDAIVPV